MEHTDITTILDNAARTTDPAPLPTPEEARSIRLAAGLSQRQIAEAIGIHRRTYRRHETGDGTVVFASTAANDRAARVFAHLAATVSAEQ